VTVATVELQVLAAPAVVPPAAAPAPTTPAAVVNVGLRSDTGVQAAEAGATRTGALATGAGLLVLAGVGAVVLRTRRDPGVDD
jgi:hypothetical protein